MRFNEWITQNKEEFADLITNKDLGMETMQEDDLIESQLDQWVHKLMGLLHTVPSNKKHKFLEKVISELQASMED